MSIIVSTRTGPNPLCDEPPIDTRPLRLPVQAVAGAADAASHGEQIRDLVMRHENSLRIFARYLTGNRDRADDLVQDAILRAIGNAEKFAAGTNFRAWICTIARNIFYSEQRRARYRHIPIHEMLHEPSTPAIQDDILHFADFRRAFQELSREQSEALILVSVSGLSCVEAASSQNCAVGTIKSRVSRARGDLKRLIAEGPIAMPRRDIEPYRGCMATAFLASIRRTPDCLAVRREVRPELPSHNDAEFQDVDELGRWCDDGGRTVEG
ncbi:RNA polymerase sigma factor (sigma-70 family) [Dongia mobilis]|uniref:RNA polymerase sigma factor n=1 Tax=Dongia mobilis TaxID=578943 RepID=A0A4R6WRW9_9PROT|nr:sigma-70 family RNA polymerase sigma factor [Dongia mobilis]TDQ82307.1 RNA polymerase sigma factor (sigma-70 family) [Dongia mobilis]